MRYILTADQVLAGEDLEVIKKGAVVVEDEKILYVGTEADAKAAYPDAEETALGDKCLMPGMFECHNHLAMDARVPGHLGMMELGACEHTIMALNGLKDDLMSGVTTARCLGDRHYIDIVLKDQIKQGKVTGPDLLVCGIGMRGLHGHGFVGVPHSGVEEFRRTARENMHRGVDTLKIFVTPGKPSTCAEDFIPCYISYDEICTVVEEAKGLNIRVAAHCIGGRGLEYCIKAGVDIIEHVYSITPELVQMVEEEHKGWIDLTSGIVLDPGREPGLNEAQIRNMQMGREYTKECVSRVCQSDKIRWTLGTDANHTLLYREAELAVECGASTLKAVRGLTVEAAKMCGVEKEKGQLAAGLKADIIAVAGNPLENVSVLSDVSFVMKGGKVYKH